MELPESMPCPVCGKPLELRKQNDAGDDLHCSNMENTHFLEIVFEDTDVDSVAEAMGEELTGCFELYHIMTFSRAQKRLENHRDRENFNFGTKYPRGIGEKYGRRLLPRALQVGPSEGGMPADEDPTQHL